AFTALGALSMSRLRGDAAAPRVLWFVGAGATERVDADLRRRIDEQLPNRVHITGGDGAAQRVAPLIARAITLQESEHRRIGEAIRLRAASRDDVWWAARYASASPDDPLRALILTTRFSSYMKHAADDLATALRAQGVDARLHIEPDAHMRPASV